ncbi:MAG: hypothetical protein H8M99_12335 [Gloeobacteraceae cyanobacterium ES-bin-144]|nr:hypothetical protein [Verrucomicrobiales bacterium]
MKTLPIISILLPAIFVFADRMAAQDAEKAKTTAYQGSVSQEQLRGMTQRLKTDMTTLLDEFGQYSAAAEDLKKLKEALEQLDTVSEQDMANVVRILREASRTEKPEDAKSKMVEASSAQKEIQTLLRDVADRLTLQRDAASVQQRLEQLAVRQLANLRETQKLAESGASPEKLKPEQKKAQALNKAEQESLREEIRMAMDSLRNLAKNADAADKEAFEEAHKTGVLSQLQNQARKSSELLDTDFKESAKAQQELANDLKEMVDGLQAHKTKEEQTRELADQMKQLASKQEQLSDNSLQADKQDRPQIEKEQQAISDRLEMAQTQMEKLNPEAAKVSDQASKESKAITQDLQNKDALNNPDGVAKTSDAQKSVAEKLSTASEMLEKQADTLAAAEKSQNDQTQPEMSAAEQAISDAANQVMDAKNEMTLAQQQLENKGDQNNAMERIDSAQAKLDAAQAQLSKTGEMVPQSVGQELKSASQNAQDAKKSMSSAQTNSSLKKSQQNAENALAGLQQAANQLAAQQAQMPGTEPGTQLGEGQASQSTQAGSAKGMSKPGDARTDVSAVGGSGDSKRTALSLLQQEKASPEYEASVQQYIKNIANSANQEP